MTNTRLIPERCTTEKPQYSYISKAAIDVVVLHCCLMTPTNSTTPIPLRVKQKKDEKEIQKKKKENEKGETKEN